MRHNSIISGNSWLHSNLSGPAPQSSEMKLGIRDQVLYGAQNWAAAVIKPAFFAGNMQ